MRWWYNDFCDFLWAIYILLTAHIRVLMPLPWWVFSWLILSSFRAASTWSPIKFLSILRYFSYECHKGVNSINTTSKYLRSLMSFIISFILYCILSLVISIKVPQIASQFAYKTQTTPCYKNKKCLNYIHIIDIDIILSRIDITVFITVGVDVDVDVDVDVLVLVWSTLSILNHVFVFLLRMPLFIILSM